VLAEASKPVNLHVPQRLARIVLPVGIPRVDVATRRDVWQEEVSEFIEENHLNG